MTSDEPAVRPPLDHEVLAGAVPAAGSPSALEVTRVFDLPDMLRLLTVGPGA